MAHSSSTRASSSKELFEADRRIDHDRLHIGEVFKSGRGRPHRKYGRFFADLGAQARRAAKHLLVKDAAVDPAQEDKVLDLRHVDAGGQQVDRDRDLGQRVVAEDRIRSPTRSTLPVIFRIAASSISP